MPPSSLPSYVRRSLLTHARNHFQTSEYWIDEKDLTPQEHVQYLALVKRFIDGEPLSRIVGVREFWSLSFQLSPATLDPRSDSETIIEAVLKKFPDKTLPLKILDLGTGSGCLLLATLSEYPNAHGIGTDIQPAAIETAIKNAKTLALDHRCEFLHTSWAEGLTTSFDIILCNPPYIREDEFHDLDQNVKGYDPYIALISGPDGLECYRQVMPYIQKLLSPNGFAFLEIGQGQAEDISHLGTQHHLYTPSILRDLAGIERCLILTKHI